MTQTDGKIYYVLGLEQSIVKMTVLPQTIYRFNQIEFSQIYRFYQITNGIFHRTGKFYICMETQKVLNSQSNLEKENYNGKNQAL